MKWLSIIAIVLLLILGCQQGPKSDVSEVEQLYENYELDPTLQSAELYLDSVHAFIGRNIGDIEKIKPHLTRGVEVSKAQGLLSRTPGFILPLLRLYPDQQDRKTRLIELGEVMYALRKRHASSIIFKELFRKYPGDPALSGKSTLIDSIAQVESDYVNYLFQQILINPDQYGVNKAASLKYVDGVEALALVSPELEDVPGHLYRGAEVARSLRTFPKAMSLYDWLIEAYPDHEKAPTALFIKGFILEQDYSRSEQAREIYTEFLEKYPNHEMAESAQFLLNNLGKSDEEILESIESGEGK